jgi:hypothetical protein
LHRHDDFAAQPTGFVFGFAQFSSRSREEVIARSGTRNASYDGYVATGDPDAGSSELRTNAFIRGGESPFGVGVVSSRSAAEAHPKRFDVAGRKRLVDRHLEVATEERQAGQTSEARKRGLRIPGTLSRRCGDFGNGR